MDKAIFYDQIAMNHDSMDKNNESELIFFKLRKIQLSSPIQSKSYPPPFKMQKNLYIVIFHNDFHKPFMIDKRKFHNFFSTVIIVFQDWCS